MDLFPFRVSIARRPGRGLGQSVLLVGTLALAIGANTILFSIVNLFVLRPLPIAEPQRVGFLFGTDSAQGTNRARTSIDDFLDLAERSRSFEELAAFRRNAFTLTGRGEPERIVVEEATATLFPAWGLTVARGRGFAPTDDRPGAPPVALLSDRSWRERFDAKDSILGETLLLEGVAHTVIGVLPRAIEFGNLALVEVWTPLRPERGVEPREKRDLFVCGRLRPGVTLAAAAAEIRGLSAELRAAFPETNGSWNGRVVTTRQGLIGEGVWLVLGFLGLVVTGVLLVACANVANVLLARVAERRAEFATRAALGASAGRIMRTLLAEQMAIAATAGLLGLALAGAGLRLVKALSFEPVWSQLTLDHRVMFFAALLAALASGLAGLAPALDAARGDVRALLAGGESRGSTARHLGRLKRVLAAAQLAAAVVVVVPASLVGRSIDAEIHADWGFDGRGLSAAQLQLPARRYPDAASRLRFAERLESELASEPGIRGAALVDPLPIFGRERVAGFELPGTAVTRPEDRPRAIRVVASADLFTTLGVATYSGAELPRVATPGAPIGALVNRVFAERWLAGREPVGQRLRLGDAGTTDAEVEIQGVVADVKSVDVTLPAPPTLYLPLAAESPESFAIVVRSGDEKLAAQAIRRVVHRLDPELAVERPASFAQLNREEMSSNRTIGGLFAGFAAVAVALAVVGLFSIALFSVAQRTREFGVRMAMGADRAEIVRAVLRDGLRLTLWGGGFGLAIGAALGQLLRHRLYGVSPLDPWTFGGAALGLILLTLLALVLPAHRAAAIDPARLLRSQ